MRRATFAAVLCCLALTLAEPPAWSAAITSALSYRRFTTHDGLPQMQTETVWQDSRGYIYIGTLSGFSRFDGHVMTPLMHGRRENIVDFQEVGGRVRALGFRHYWTVEGDSVGETKREVDPVGRQLLNNFNAAALPPGYVLTEDREEQQRHLCLMTPGGLQTVSAAARLDAMTPDRKLFADSSGIYVPTAEGLFRLDVSGREERLSPRGDVYTLFRTADGALLAFCPDSVYTAIGWKAVTAMPADLAADYGVSICQTADGQLLMADGHSLYELRDGALRAVASGFNLVKDLFVDRWDRLWMATYQGVYCFFCRRFVNHHLTDANDLPRALAVLPCGQLAIGTLNGKVVVGDSIVSDDPTDFYQPSAVVIGDTAYMACSDGIAAIARGAGGGSTTRRSLPLAPDRYQFVAQAGGRLVIGTRSALLAYAPATGRLDTLSADIPRPWCAAADADGRLWVGTTFGLFSIDRDGRQQHTDHKGRNLIITAMAADSLGTVFFASADSLYVISGGTVSDAPADVCQRLRGHEIRSLHVSPRGFLVVAAIDGLFVARITERQRPTDICFFDHLTGFTLVEPQQARMAESADGTVWMPCLEGIASFRPAELLLDSQRDTFIAPPTPWWRHWWVVVPAVLLLLALAAALAMLFERRRQRRRLHRLQREKKLKELQVNAIRLKAIPHFHANVLAGIEYFLMNNDTAEATHYLKLYSDFTNMTLADIDRPARTVQEEVAYIRMYLQLEQLRYGERLSYAISVAPDVNQQQLLPTMLLHTYCQNALKHGIGSRPQGGHIAVSIGTTEDDIVVSVEDDGIGREAAAHLNTGSTRQGLRILMEQIALYNQTNSRPICQSVDDLMDEQGRPAGTRFRMTVPKNYNFGQQPQTPEQ